MAIDLATFVTEFPEFAATATSRAAYVQSHLDAALPYCDAVMLGSMYQRGVFLKAAHTLSMSPFGENARLNKSDGQTTYSAMFDDMLRHMPARCTVSGEGWPW